MIIKSINHEVTYVRPPPQPIYFAWVNVSDSIIPELWKVHSCLLKSRGTEGCLKARVELKLSKRKSDFWNLFARLESRRLFKNWSFRVYLKIRLLNVRKKILEIKFERDWNFENDLRARDFKWVDKWRSE